MITPIATIVFAAAMALSLSVEAESFFHAPTGASDADASDGEAPADDEPSRPEAPG